MQVSQLLRGMYCLYLQGRRVDQSVVRRASVITLLARLTFNLTMEAVNSSETSVNITRIHEVTEESILRSHNCEILQCHIVKTHLCNNWRKIYVTSKYPIYSP
jgi:hypothetical protein